MEPITRSEQYLASIIGEDVVLPVPQSRIEHYLNLIAQNGISPSSAIASQAAISTARISSNSCRSDQSFPISGFV